MKERSFVIRVGEGLNREVDAKMVKTLSYYVQTFSSMILEVSTGEVYRVNIIPILKTCHECNSETRINRVAMKYIIYCKFANLLNSPPEPKIHFSHNRAWKMRGEFQHLDQSDADMFLFIFNGLQHSAVSSIPRFTALRGLRHLVVYGI